MSNPVQIYGKANCPYTDAALADYRGRSIPVEYFDVREDDAAMKRFIELSGGKRRVPLIVDGGKILIGFGGS